jgi:hypothetical protein
MTHLVEFKWQKFDSESCPEEYCGPPTERREDAWKDLWDRRYEPNFINSFVNQI